MRKLTVYRRKSFVSCLIKMKVYIEDPVCGDTIINKTPCRKLGNLKNGEEKTFEIDNNAAKVYVIADKLSKGFCNEFYEIPEGEEDIALAGENKYNLFNGNAFRFDGNDSEAVRKNRKKGIKIGIIIFSISVAVGFAIGFIFGSGLFDKETEPKTFTVNNMIITLTDEFEKVEEPGFTACFLSDDVMVMIFDEDLKDEAGFEDLTAFEYAEIFITYNNLSLSEPKDMGGKVCFDYESTVDRNTFLYKAFVYENDGIFWVVQFATLKEDADNHEQKILDWADSVAFTE